MRLLVLKTAYHEYIPWFYRLNPSLSERNFIEQTEALERDCFWGGGGNVWREPMAGYGIEVEERLINVSPLQWAWARERGIRPKRFPRWAWIGQIAEAQIQENQPDVVFIQDCSIFSAAFLSQLRERHPSIKVFLGWCGAPYSTSMEESFVGFDAVLSCIPEIVQQLTARGFRARHLHHAFDPRVLERLDGERGTHASFLFAGRIVDEPGYHRGRFATLSVVRKKTPLEIFSSSRRWGFFYRYKPPVFGLEMYATLQRAKIVLNSHIDASFQSASNIRLFEATGVGACLLTERKENLKSLFEDGREVATYASPEECIEKANWLLSHESSRKAIASAGQKRTLSEHTYQQRAGDLVKIINSC